MTGTKKHGVLAEERRIDYMSALEQFAQCATALRLPR
jgi:hypothetical protein